MPPELIPYHVAMRSADGLVRLKAHTLGAVAAIAPNSVAGLIAFTRRRRVSDLVGLETGGAGVCERFLLDGYVVDPFAPQHMPDSGAAVLALADLNGTSVAYRWQLRTLGLGDRVTMYLRSSGTIVAMIALGRSADEPPFTHDELHGLRRMQPLIERAYRCGVEPPEDSGRRPVLLPAGLSSRETDVAELVSRGASNAEIALSLHLSEATVKSHMTRIFAKTGVRTRTQLALLLGQRTVHG